MVRLTISDSYLGYYIDNTFADGSEEKEQMTDKEAVQSKKLADIVVEKFRTLVDLESRVLDTREEIHRISIAHNDAEQSDLQEDPIVEHKKMLIALELQLQKDIEEMEKIMVKLATPCFRTYILPQMNEVVETLKACGAADRKEPAQLVDALMNEESVQSLEQLETAIITRLRHNLEKTFGV